MEIVTGFESTKPSDSLNHKIELGHIIKSVECDLDIALNAFTRWAKERFSSQIKNAFKDCKIEIVTVSNNTICSTPIWVLDLSIIAILNDPKSESYLNEIVDSLAKEVIRTGEGKGTLVLLDALDVRISPIMQDSVFRFGVKQKWSVK